MDEQEKEVREGRLSERVFGVDPALCEAGAGVEDGVVVDVV